MKTITIVSKDEIGLLADISYILAKENINIETLSADAVADKAIVTLGVKDDSKARAALMAAGYAVSEADALVIKLQDKPGELNRVTTMLSDKKINISNVLLLSSDGRNTVLSITVDNIEKARNLLKEYIFKENE